MATWATMNDLSTGDLVTETDMDTLRGNIEYLLNPNHEAIVYGTGNYLTTSTSFVDVDATNLSITLTTNGGPVLVTFTCQVYSSANVMAFDITVDGTRVGAGYSRGLTAQDLINDFDGANVSCTVLVTGLAAGSHTFKLQHLSGNGGNAIIMASSTYAPVSLSAIEL